MCKNFEYEIISVVKKKQRNTPSLTSEDTKGEFFTAFWFERAKQWAEKFSSHKGKEWDQLLSEHLWVAKELEYLYDERVCREKKKQFQS